MDSVFCPCRWETGTWAGPVGLGIEVAARVTEVSARVTEVVALLVTGAVVQAPFVVPWGGEDLGGQVGPSEDP